MNGSNPTLLLTHAQSLFDRLISAGTSPSYSRYVNQAYRVSNTIALMVLLNSLGFVILFSFSQLPTLALISLLALTLYSLGYLMMWKKRQMAARTLFLLSGNFIVYYAVALAGTITRLQYLFFSICICSLMMFNWNEGKRRTLFFTSLPILLLVIGEWTQFSLPGVEQMPRPTNLRLIQIFSMIASILNVVAGIVYFHRQVAIYQTEIDAYVVRLHDEHQRHIQDHKMASLGEMAGGMAHEINNPLAVITLRAHQMRQSIENRNESASFESDLLAGVNRILTTSDRISKIIASLRAFARIADQDPFETVPVSQLAEDTLELCSQRVLAAGIRLNNEVPSDLKIECRPTQIVQVLLNLVNNAYDACSTTQDARVTIRASSAGSRILIQVRNNGPRIPPETVSRIFEPFYTTKRTHQGTGLGLSISKGLIEDHEGELVLLTDETETVFEIRLPMEQAKELQS